MGMEVSFNDVSTSGLRDDQYPFNYLGGKFDCSAVESQGQCVWASLQFADGSWVNATTRVAEIGNKLILTPASTTRSSLGAPVASSYAWGAIPMMNVYDKQTDLPVLPWSEKVSSSISSMHFVL